MRNLASGSARAQLHERKRSLAPDQAAHPEERLRLGFVLRRGFRDARDQHRRPTESPLA